jgi:hypothetical protein
VQVTSIGGFIDLLLETQTPASKITGVSFHLAGVTVVTWQVGRAYYTRAIDEHCRRQQLLDDRDYAKFLNLWADSQLRALLMRDCERET